jgi:hypothetical protein
MPTTGSGKVLKGELRKRLGGQAPATGTAGAAPKTSSADPLAGAAPARGRAPSPAELADVMAAALARPGHDAPRVLEPSGEPAASVPGDATHVLAVAGPAAALAAAVGAWVAWGARALVVVPVAEGALEVEELRQAVATATAGGALSSLPLVPPPG